MTTTVTSGLVWGVVTDDGPFSRRRCERSCGCAADRVVCPRQQIKDYRCVARHPDGRPRAASSLARIYPSSSAATLRGEPMVLHLGSAQLTMTTDGVPTSGTPRGISVYSGVIACGSRQS